MGSNDRYDPLSDQVVESVSISWEEMKGYNGAFKLTQPGQYAYQQSLCQQPFTPSPQRHTGVYLSGDTTSWAGGWVEGAFRSGLDAAIIAAVIPVDGLAPIARTAATAKGIDAGDVKGSLEDPKIHTAEAREIGNFKNPAIFP